MGSINSRLDTTKQKIIELKDIAIGNILNERQRNKNVQKQIKKLCDNCREPNSIHVIGIPEGGEEHKMFGNFNGTHDKRNKGRITANLSWEIMQMRNWAVNLDS